MENLPDVHLLGAYDMLFGVYQDWVHQNPGNHLDGGITEDGKWQARWGKLACMPTKRYDVPSGKVGRIFVGTLSVELDGLQDWNWNYKRVIVFQSVILEHAQRVNNSKNILARKCF